MKKYLTLLLLVAGCSGTPIGPYSADVAKTGDGEYKLIMTGDRGVSGKKLKTYIKHHGKEICGKEKVFLLRGVREDENPGEHRTVVKADIDCVGTDYFK